MIEVQDVRWERVFLKIEYVADSFAGLQLYRVSTNRFIPFVETALGDGRYEASLNISQGFGREPIGEGNWIICQRLTKEEATYGWAEEHAPYLLVLAEKRLQKNASKRLLSRMRRSDDCTFGSRQIAQSIEENPYTTHRITYKACVMEGATELSKIFRYSKGTYAIGASLLPAMDGTDYFTLTLAIAYYQKKRRPKARKITVRQVERLVFGAYYRFAEMILRPKKDTVLFLKENGEHPTDNLIAIRDRMRERGLDVHFPITERYRNTFRKRQSIRDWLGDINAIARSRYVFIDDYCPVFNFVVPSERTVVTQVWHAGVGFKSVGYARFGIKGSPDPFLCSHRRYTYALIGNENLREIYSEVFGIEKSALLATGMPRLDYFLDEERMRAAKEKLESKYPWMQKGRVVVFAPTFRGSGQKDAYYPYEEYLNWRKLFEMCEATNSYFVLEMHHFIAEPPQVPEEYLGRIKDLSSESLAELSYIADVLVTDYSSCFYDFLLLQRPIVFYVPDKVEYSSTRGVQRSVDDMAPGVVCDSFDEMIDVLENNRYSETILDESLLDRCLEQSGLASDRVIDAVLLEKRVAGVFPDDAIYSDFG